MDMEVGDDWWMHFKVVNKGVCDGQWEKKMTLSDECCCNSWKRHCSRGGEREENRCGNDICSFNFGWLRLGEMYLREPEEADKSFVKYFGTVILSD
jgi:hypothetical protein